MKFDRNAEKRAGFLNCEYGTFQVSYQPIQAGIFNIYLFGEIEDATQFVPAIEVLSAAKENDIVVIHLSTNGGSLDATDTFITAMRECEARVIVRASGGVHSAGTVILLNADEFTLSENFNALIHNGSCGAIGKFSDFRSQAHATERYMDKVMRSTYEGFLTEDEIEDLIGGKDIWLDAEQFLERWNRRNDLLEQSAHEVMEMVQALAEEEEEEPPKPKRKRKKAE